MKRNKARRDAINADVQRAVSRKRRTRCPHGKRIGECNACDIAADLAFDSAREGRFFRG